MKKDLMKKVMDLVIQGENKLFITLFWVGLICVYCSLKVKFLTYCMRVTRLCMLHCVVFRPASFRRRAL